VGEINGLAASPVARSVRSSPAANRNVEQQDEGISVQDLLIFNTSYIESPKQLSYIAEAIVAGSRHLVLPSYYASVSCFASLVADTEDTGRQ
jgi:hypothetical protein